MSDVISMAEHCNDGMLQSPLQILNEALDNVVNESHSFKGKKMVIIALDDSDDEYNISMIQAGMKNSEMVSLFDIAKGISKEEMGY